jgi:hypothetical protein
MRTEHTEPPSGPELDGILRQTRHVVLSHTERRPARKRSLRIAAFAIGALVIFGGGVSLGSAVAAPVRTFATPVIQSIKVACFDAPSSSAAFGYLSVDVVAGSDHAAPSTDCERVWEESAELSSLRAGALFVEQQYEQGLCTSGGALTCAPIAIPSSSGATPPPNWADCSQRAGYDVEVGYSSGGAAAACRAQGLSTR